MKREDHKAHLQAESGLSHGDAVMLLVDYHFGRLSPAQTAAVEAHLRTCDVCQREGLRHAPTERREAARKSSRLRPQRQRRSRSQTRLLLVLLLVLGAVSALAYMQGQTHALSGVVSLLSSSRAQKAETPDVPALTAARQFDVSSRGAVAVAMSPQGTSLAASRFAGAGPEVVLFDAKTGHATTTLVWSGSSVPTVLDWSPNGQLLAAADGKQIGIWSIAQSQLTWTSPAPARPAVRVFDVETGNVIQQPDPASAFADGTFLQWGADGQLTRAPAGAAGPSGIETSDGPLIGLWQARGSHLAGQANGTVRLGSFSADDNVLQWSPDARYLLWGALNQPLALTKTTAAAASTGIAPPNAVVALVAQRLAQAKRGEAMAWFAPDGQRVAICDATASALTVYDVVSGAAVGAVPGVCHGAHIQMVTWQPDMSGLVLARTDASVTVYPLASAHP